jgi:tRNA(Ile)-lysidine synthase
MPTTSRDPVITVRDAVQLWRDRLGPGLYGVACSGGIDSMALADAAITELGASNVVVIHVDHGLSAGSGKVAAGVTAWAAERGVASVVRAVEVVQGRSSLETAAREARYRALDAIREEVGLGWILLAHTARDQAETVLMRIVRGTGPAGLAGIPMIRGHYLRPLLRLPRATIEAYVATRALPTWDDPMNRDPAFTRVRFRDRILPALRVENPALDEALVRLADSAREWMGTIDTLAEPYAHFPIACIRLLELDDAVRKRAFALALDAEGLGYDATVLEQIDDLVLRRTDGEHELHIPGARVVRTYDVLDLVPAGRAPVPPHEMAAEPDVLDAPAPGPYEVRRWRPGDRMKPARLKGRSKKLSDLFIDAKVPRALRATARVVVRTEDQVIVWAEHVGLAYGESESVIPVPRRTGGSF